MYHISIHALLAESDPETAWQYVETPAFLSTLSLRRATSKKFLPMCIINHFYPRSPCGERRGRHVRKTRTKNFYPRSPCGERLRLFFIVFDLFRFLSTLSLRRATPKRLGNTLKHLHFYPRSPCGERQLDELCRMMGIKHFYPRSPCGERRLLHGSESKGIKISIHALLAESDNPPSITPTASRNFYPRSPCGERPVKGKPASPVIGISIHALLAESDFIFSLPLVLILQFLSTLSLRRATFKLASCAIYL